jgi:hypothetical protein
MASGSGSEGSLGREALLQESQRATDDPSRAFVVVEDVEAVSAVGVVEQVEPGAAFEACPPP